MAVTERYCDPGGGNDYIGASFTDGVYTSATKTLVKASAFTANKVNHYLYLTDNGSGLITPGYYKIATWTDANTVVLATDAGGGSDATDVKCTQADGSSSLPFHTVQGALDLTTRNSTDGDRISVKSGMADTLNASLNYATYGLPTVAAQLVVQGYTSSAGDGGIGEINGAGSYGICSGWAYVVFADMKVGNCGSADVLDLGAGSCVLNCEIHTSSGYGVDTGQGDVICGCWFHDLTGAQAIDMATEVRVLYCYIDCTTATNVIDGGQGSSIIGNIINLSGADTSVIGIDAVNLYTTIVGNTIYCSQDNASQAIRTTQAGILVLNNIIEGWDGAGGDGIETESYNSFVGANAVYNCTNAYTLDAAKLNYAIAPNDTLGSSPFTDAAGDDFSIKDSQTGVTEDAYPSSFRGL